MASYLKMRAAFDVEVVHIGSEDDQERHVTTDGIWCSCLPFAFWGAICPDRRIMVEGTAAPEWPLVQIIQHNKGA